MSKLDRVGETILNTFGSTMIIVEYRGARDIDVFFPKYDYIAEGVPYGDFKKGSIRCPYEPRVYGHGFLGEGKRKVHDENGKHTKCYATWHSMLERCYSPKCYKKYHTYINCTVSKEFLNFQNFGDWFDDNYYEIEGEQMTLDKDISVKGNKIYSSDTCVFVPQRINKLFVKRDEYRGELPIGVCYHKQTGKYVARCSVYDYDKNKKKTKHLGYYDTQEQAFEVYKQFKENYIKEVADYYKDKIPSKLYDAMCNYEININD